jgi:ABC-type lipoprotein export system ATPase subunit
MMAGALLEPDSGTVEVNDTNPFELSQEKRASFRAQNIGFVFQEFHLIPYLSVLENVLAPTLACKVADARKKAKELLDRLGLAARSAHVPAELSTGEKQRVALARALLPSPKLLLADEPTGNLDSENAGIVLGYLKDCAARGCAVLVVTHNREVVSCADHSIPMGESAVPSA